MGDGAGEVASDARGVRRDRGGRADDWCSGGRFEQLNIEELEAGRATVWEPGVGRSKLLHGGYIAKFQVNEPTAHLKKAS